VTKSYSRILLPVLGVSVETRGVSRVDRNAPYVFMSNHASHVDSLALAVSIPHPLHWVFKKELSKIPVFGWVLLSLGRSWWTGGNAMQSRTALSNAASALQGNNSVLIYVEGTRSKDGKLQPLKKGGFHIALHSDCRSYRSACRGATRSSLRARCASGPGHVVVELFDPDPDGGEDGGGRPGAHGARSGRAALLNEGSRTKKAAVPAPTTAAAVRNIASYPNRSATKPKAAAPVTSPMSKAAVNIAIAIAQEPSPPDRAPGPTGPGREARARPRRRAHQDDARLPGNRGDQEIPRAHQDQGAQGNPLTRQPVEQLPPERPRSDDRQRVDEHERPDRLRSPHDEVDGEEG